MSDINLIKTVLFNAPDIKQACFKLAELGIAYRLSDVANIYFIDEHNVQFWGTTSARCPIAVFIDNALFTIEERTAFFAGQPETVATQVPAGSTDTVGQQPYTCPHCKKSLDDTTGCNIHEPSTESVDNNAPEFINWHEPADRLDYVKSYVKIPQLRNILRTERRLKNSRVKGLSS